MVPSGSYHTSYEQNLAVLVYRLVCQPVTLESWVRLPDAAEARLPPHSNMSVSTFCAKTGKWFDVVIWARRLALLPNFYSSS
jgi:hypothetical protein